MLVRTRCEPLQSQLQGTRHILVWRKVGQCRLCRFVDDFVFFLLRDCRAHLVGVPACERHQSLGCVEVVGALHTWLARRRSCLKQRLDETGIWQHTSTR